jgi:hypothetical protein
MQIPAIEYEDNITRMFHRSGTFRLTAYEFACGYVQEIDTNKGEMKGTRLQLWKEHNCFHVRAHNHDTNERIFWDSFNTLTEANKRFYKAAKELNLENHLY